LLPILLPIQIFSQNQIFHHFISNGEEKLSSPAFSILFKEELNTGEYNVELSAKSESASGGNTYSISSGIYLYQLKVYSVDNEAGEFILTKKMKLPG